MPKTWQSMKSLSVGSRHIGRCRLFGRGQCDNHDQYLETFCEMNQNRLQWLRYTQFYFTVDFVFRYSFMYTFPMDFWTFFFFNRDCYYVVLITFAIHSPNFTSLCYCGMETWSHSTLIMADCVFECVSIKTEVINRRQVL